ncbi:hypothetical protein FALBO_3013 [Fusarium albosuccineum]|uniref:Uncharacterized protein n=1 Tax=Fusarium albosuccineum TaxID=1237068 RepID=A0A8H4LIM0_9HYPO|nr:hypothetical protein FALBO_3013 [Fusarium albosuccineum]
MPPANETNARTPPSSTTRTPVTQENLDVYLRHHYNFEKIPLGLPTTPKDMEGYCTEWQANFDAVRT